MAVVTRGFEVSKDFKELITKFSEEKGRSVSSITDLLFYEYWKGRITLDYCPMSMDREESVQVGLHPDNLSRAIEYRRNIASHTSLRWVFVNMWEKLMKGEIEI